MPGYPARTRANVVRADAVLWLGVTSSPGGRLTLGTANRMEVPSAAYDDIRMVVVPELAEWIAAHLEHGGRLLVAGNRESSNPGIGAAAERLLVEVFTLLKEAKSR